MFKIVLLFNLAVNCLWGSVALRFEGFLREVHIVQTLHEEEIAEKIYALLLDVPTTILLPNGDIQRICFLFVKISDEEKPYIGKYVAIEGEWVGMDLHPFADVGIMRVEKISDDHWINTDKESEAACCFVDEKLPIMAEAACKLARWEALASGCNVLEVENGWLIEVSPDGGKRLVRKI